MLCAPGVHRKIRIERGGALVSGPVAQRFDLWEVSLGNGGLDDEVDLLMTELVDRSRGRLEGAQAAPEAVVVALAERVDAHRKAGDASTTELQNPVRSQQGSVGPHHHRGASLDAKSSDGSEVAPQERLSAGKDEHGRRAELQDLFRDSAALVGGELSLRAFSRAGRNVTVSALEVTAPSEVPGDDVGNRADAH